MHRSPLVVRTVQFFVCVLLACFASALPAQTDRMPFPTLVVPFDNQAGHDDIILRVRVNDKLTGNFLLDTGAGVSIIDGDFVKKLGLHITPTVRRPPVYLSGREIDDVTLSRLRVGNMILKDLDFFVEPGTRALKSGSESICAKEEAQERKEHPERFKDPEPLEQEIDGILGIDVLNQFALLIDFEKNEITAVPGGDLRAGDLQDLGMAQSTAIPLSQEYQGGNHYYATAEFINGDQRGSEKMVLDTGAEDTLIAPHLADAIKVLVKHQGFSQTFYGCLPFSEGVVDSVNLNGLVLPKIGISFTHKAPEDFPLLLGYNVLSRCRVLLDFPGNKLYLQAIPNIEKDDKPSAQYSDVISYQPGPNGEVFFPVQFDGANTGTAVLDTGANHTLVSPDLATRLGMALTPMPDAPDTAMQASKIPLMRFGGTGVAGQNCLVAQGPLKIAGKPVDVLLGNDFLAGFMPFIDFQKHQVTFLQTRDLTGGDFEKIGMGNAATIPLVNPAPYLYGASVQVTGGHTLDETFLISTVDPRTVLSSQAAQTLKLKPKGVAASATTPMGQVNAAAVDLDEFSVTGIDAPDAMTFRMQTDEASLPMSILGLDYLTHYRVLLDYTDGRLFLARPDTAKPADAAIPLAPPLDKKP